MHHQDTLLVGAVQLNVKLGDLDHNLARHQAYIAEACRLELELLVFPELSLTGYGLGSRVMEVAMSAQDTRLITLAESAGAMQTVVGFVEMASPGEYYNALAVLQHGRVQAIHRKLNLPTYGGLEEGKWFCQGTQLTYTEARPGWTSTTLICADLWNPALVHAALLSRPTVLCAPINSASGIVSGEFSNERNWLLNVGFYAMTYGTPIILANRFGPEGECHFWGGSRILGPRGETLAVAEDTEMLVSASLSRREIGKARFELPTHRDADTALIQRLLAARLD